ncbi:alpha/beta fold hydrolase [Chitinophaga solisilvae]|uniref:alpha/beta fold hydrolase n=1 Tax=Chitinophaga solisilvae TaxID=1233460 RepID=UPI001370046A|nr:alpha/beta hydrolase [Chitinophaga solisilvae]
MRKIFLLPVLLLPLLQGQAQTTDSIRYANGYLYYHTYGHGEPIIVLSGGPGNSCMQQEEVATELGRKYKAVLLEQRGTGLSIPTPFDSTTINMKAAMEDINRLMDRLKVKQILIYGHSWGAMLAMNFAANYPQKVKRLLLVCPGYYKMSTDLYTTHVNNVRARMGPEDMIKFDSLSKLMGDKEPPREVFLAYNRIMRMSYIYNKLMIDSMLKKIEVAKSNTHMQQLMIGDLWRIRYDLSKTLYRYRGPIDVIAARQDVLAFYTYELKIIHPAAKLHWIQASGHFPMFEQRTAFYNMLDSLLTR